eukprot:gene3067-5237_t
MRSKYFLESSSNLVVKQLTKLRKENANNTALVLGRKLIFDLTKVLTPTKLILDSSFENNIPKELKKLNCEIYFTKQKILNKISGLKNSDGFIGEFQLEKKNENKKKIKKMLIIDKIQNPGNLGTIFRTASAFNFDFIFLIDNTVNALNEKCIRSSQGTSMLLDSSYGSVEEAKEILEKHNLIGFLAKTKNYEYDIHKNSKEIKELLEKHDGFCLIMGNESRGSNLTSENIVSLSIPIHNIESLNVSSAASILINYLSSF